MAIILISFFIVYYCFHLSGQICIKYFDKRFPISTREFQEPFFIGFILFTVISSYLSIFTPLSFTTFLIYIIVVSILSIIFLKRDVNFWETLSKSKFILATVIFAIILTLTVASTGVYVGDTWLYHAQNVQWIRKYPVVPGLAHLQPQLGQKSQFFIISALFTIDFKDILGLGPTLSFPINGTVFLVTVYVIVKHFVEGLRLKNNAAIGFFGFLMTILILWFPRLVSSLSPDIICSFIIIICYSILFLKGFKLGLFHFSFLTALIFLSVTFKLSMVFLGITLMVILIKQFSFKRVVLITIIGATILLPYFIRNYFLTGYLIYPISFIDFFNPDWKIPSEKLDFEVQVIKSWARAHTAIGDNLSITNWIPEWLTRIELIFKSILVINLISLTLLVYYIKNKMWDYALLSSTIILNLVFWFFNAPDIRFALGFLIIGASIFFALLTKKLPNNIFQVFENKYFKFFTLIFLIFIGSYYHRSFFTDWNGKNFILPINPPEDELKEQTTNFTYYITRYPARCNNHEIPCTSRPPKEELLLRGDNLKSGFKLGEN